MKFLLSLGIAIAVGFCLIMFTRFFTKDGKNTEWTGLFIDIAIPALWVIYFIIEGFWRGLLMGVVSVFPAWLGICLGSDIAMKIFFKGYEYQKDNKSSKSEANQHVIPARTVENRNFRVNKEGAMENLQYEYKRTATYFKESYYISKDFDNGADEILMYMEHFVKMLHQSHEDVEFLRDSDDTITLKLQRKINGFDYTFKYTSYAWYRDESDNQHRKCRISEGNIELEYDLVSNDYSSVWKYKDPNKTITARHNSGVKTM